MTCGDMDICLPPGMGWEDPQDAYDIDSVGKRHGEGFGKGKGKGDGSCNICGQFGHWSRECPSNLKRGGKRGKGFGKSNSFNSFGKGGKGHGKNWQGPGMVKVVMGKALGTKVHASTASKLGIRQLSARTHVWLRRSLRWVQVPRFRLVV